MHGCDCMCMFAQKKKPEASVLVFRDIRGTVRILEKFLVFLWELIQTSVCLNLVSSTYLYRINYLSL